MFRFLRSAPATLMVIVALLAFGAVASAQTITGSISGAVTDANGGMIPSATVTLTSEKTGQARGSTTVAARFEDDSLRVGRMQLGKREVVSILNWTNAPQDVSLRLNRRSRITDFWTDAVLGTHSGKFEIKDMPARSGRLISIHRLHTDDLVKSV